MKELEKIFAQAALYPADLHLFDGTQKSTDSDTDDKKTDLNKTYYSRYLIELAEAELVHDQFAVKQPIPAHGGKTIEFRRYAALSDDYGTNTGLKLAEGVTPTGQKYSVSVVTATIAQYGGYVELSDVLDTAAIDPQIVQVTKMIASQAGRVMDRVTREELCSSASVSVQYGAETRTARTAVTSDDRITVKGVRMAVRTLERASAPKINGTYVGIIHPDCAFDLMDDDEWKKPHEYVDTANLYSNEIGMVAGVRFVQTARAKKYVSAGADGQDVYATLIMGDGAFATTELDGLGLQHIIKQRGSAGTADPLDQRATVGWKATKAVAVLVPEYIVRYEHASSTNSHTAN